jgi:hypothetical protein
MPRIRRKFAAKVEATKSGIASGGEIDIESGGALKIAGTDRTAALATSTGTESFYWVAVGT